MKQKLTGVCRLLQKIYLGHKKLIISFYILIVSVLVLLIFICNILVGSYGKYILRPEDNRHVAVGLVLGAGITKSGKPFRELQARLDAAAAALNDGHVDKLILSGDNRFKDYSEPDAMINYLVQTKGIAASKLQADYAGRSTYESCERAAKIFGLKETIIYSAGSHLPRAIYLCRHFGITSYGVSSGVEADNSGRHELLARVKAVFNIYIIGERTVLGHSINL